MLVCYSFMKKLFILFAVIVFNFNANAQNQNEVVGYYQLRGGSHYLKPDGTFVILGYATLITGKWFLKEHGIVNFVPDEPKESFLVYGRHTPELKENSKFMLSNNLYEEETFLHVGKLDGLKPRLQPIYVKGHRCIKFPEVYTTNKKTDTISFTSLPYYLDVAAQDYQSKIYTFYNTDKFNDFIVYYFKKDGNFTPFSYLYRDGGLHYGKHFGEKQNLEEALSESEFAQISKIDFSPKIIVSTPLYNMNESDFETDLFKQNYYLDEKRNAYISKYNYEAGEENNENYDYNNTNLLNIYKMISTFETFKSPFVSEGKSIIKDHCKDKN